MGTSGKCTNIANGAQLQTIQISSMILTVRDEPVMLDSDLAMLYGVETRVLNQAVKRNIARFPEHYRFQLTDEEKAEVITICDNPDRIKFGPVAPYVFNERGVAMLSAVLHTTVFYALTTLSIISAHQSKTLARSGSHSLCWRTQNPPTL